MPDIIKINRDSFPSFFLVAAVTKAGDEKRDSIVDAKGEYAVTLSVNGVEIPFAETMDDLWKRAEAEIEERVQKRAEEMIAQRGIAQVEDALREIESKMKRAINEVDPLSLRDDAERFRKLRAAINHLARIPTALADFIATTAGSNIQGINDEVDKMVDYRLPFDQRH